MITSINVGMEKRPELGKRFLRLVIKQFFRELPHSGGCFKFSSRVQFELGV